MPGAWRKFGVMADDPGTVARFWDEIGAPGKGSSTSKVSSGPLDGKSNVGASLMAVAGLGGGAMCSSLSGE